MLLLHTPFTGCATGLALNIRARATGTIPDALATPPREIPAAAQSLVPMLVNVVWIDRNAQVPLRATIDMMQKAIDMAVFVSLTDTDRALVQIKALGVKSSVASFVHVQYPGRSALTLRLERAQFRGARSTSGQFNVALFTQQPKRSKPRTAALRRHAWYPLSKNPPTRSCMRCRFRLRDGHRPGS
ncbi:hypothetical protein PHYPSEUDO_004981 [Phytophthora pseudosyringae]|uniref:Uncharacterized protein n=1 Tax=Phytophthora pseudosyringae TaxID=221518 RepID=A0A8T1WDI1_9STRA|nr:hypothetical protein PHYPSEUDO_004981 [Phytophthora pseudosyringae]